VIIETATLDAYADIRDVESRSFGDEGRARLAELKAAAERVRQTYPPLESWPLLSPYHRRVYLRDADTLRCARVRELVGQGTHVLDIGGGRGYIAGLLIRDSSLASYTGFDLSGAFSTSFEGMLEANHLQGIADTHTEVKDLYTLTPEWVARRPPDVALCFEVLEHVPDAERALRVIADSLPVGCLLAFSVPLYGRLEQVFSHVSIFDADRIDAMVRAAGLEVVSAEPIANRWSLVMTCKPELRPEPEPVIPRGVLAAPDPYVHDADPSQIEAVGTSPARRAGSAVQVSIASSPSRVDKIFDLVGRVQRKIRRPLPHRYRRFFPLIKHRQQTSARAGLQVPVQGTLARAQVRLTGPDGAPLRATQTHLEARAMSGDRCLARWVCDRPGRPLSQPHRLVLRRGTAVHPFEVVGTHDTQTPADRIEILATVHGGEQITLSLDRVGWAWR
jgi:2-polyprenyl-3-methyl-5-hydroxy-6-metoxy-1,4-benzoquinol methylase